ncbi:MAG TPA: hypothetical protein VFO36_10520, partial [Nitrospiraceae bacterium]|nr:hypothetical protein [Nitrospiraceae bacterium]
RVYVRPPQMLGRMYVDRSARAASDHLPVIADLDLEQLRSLATGARHDPGLAAARAQAVRTRSCANDTSSAPAPEGRW